MIFHNLFAMENEKVKEDLSEILTERLKDEQVEVSLSLHRKEENRRKKVIRNLRLPVTYEKHNIIRVQIVFS